MRTLRLFGILLIIIGAVFIFDGLRITGFSIFEGAETKTISVIGILFIIGGVVLLGTTQTIEREKTGKLEIRVKDESRGRSSNLDGSYVLYDKTSQLGSERLTLGQLKREIGMLKKEKDGDEYISLIRETYGPTLQQLANSQDEETSRVAGEFLRVLGQEIIINSKEYHLSSEEKNHIREIFRPFDGTITPQIKRLFKDYELSYDDSRSKHYKIKDKDGNVFVLPSTPSDRRTGLNIAAQLIRFIEKNSKQF